MVCYSQIGGVSLGPRLLLHCADGGGDSAADADSAEDPAAARRFEIDVFL